MTGRPEVVTAAAEALHDIDCNDGEIDTCGRWLSGSNPASRFHSLHVQHINYYRDRAAAMLEAAAPLIAAAAWRAGYGQGRDDEASGLPLREGPP